MEINSRPISNRNAITGCFLKGSIPHNKGKKWKDFIDGRKKRKMLRGLELGRKQINPIIAGFNKKAIVGIKNGKMYPFESSEDAFRKVGICARNIRSCCAGKRNSAGGIKWFYDSDVEVWKKLLI